MLALIIDQFKDRLFFGIHRDLIDLMRIENLTSQTARTLYNGGIQTLIDLANGSVFDIETILFNSFSFDTHKLEEKENRETEFRYIYVTGKPCLTVREMAKLLINDARNYLEQEIGIHGGIKWHTNLNDIECTNITQKKENIFTNNLSTIATPTDYTSQQENIVTTSNILENSSKIVKSHYNNRDQLNLKQIDSINFSNNILSHPEEDNKIILIKNSLQIIDVFGNRNFFQNFIKEIKKNTEFALSIGVEKIVKLKPIIGENLLISQLRNNVCKFNLQYDGNYYVACITICLDSNNCVYYFDMQNDNDNISIEINFKDKIEFLQTFFQRTDIKIRLFDAKDQLKILHKTILSSKKNICTNIEDTKILDWLFQPNEEKTLFEMVCKFRIN